MDEFQDKRVEVSAEGSGATTEPLERMSRKLDGNQRPHV